LHGDLAGSGVDAHCDATGETLTSHGDDFRLTIRHRAKDDAIYTVSKKMLDRLYRAYPAANLDRNYKRLTNPFDDRSVDAGARDSSIEIHHV
jgi:hypothetical protein